jgi:ferredoxin-NADP reductase
MTQTRVAEVFQWVPLSKDVAIFKLRTANGGPFPDYDAGQNITLYRPGYSMIFSIVSAPYQMKEAGFLEFMTSREEEFQTGEQLGFSERASGDFTLERTRNFKNVVFVATGTGVAPFISMIRQLTHSGRTEKRYTLIHASRKFEELGYYNELSRVADGTKIDFLYVPTVSRPSAMDWNLPQLGKGRAGNLLRKLLHLPYKGEAVLPDSLIIHELGERLDPRSTIILACGSHASLSDIKDAAREKRIRFEKEDW